VLVDWLLQDWVDLLEACFRHRCLLRRSQDRPDRVALLIRHRPLEAAPVDSQKVYWGVANWVDCPLLQDPRLHRCCQVAVVLRHHPLQAFLQPRVHLQLPLRRQAETGSAGACLIRPFPGKVDWTLHWEVAAFLDWALAVA
jgi:hypothetical protein